MYAVYIPIYNAVSWEPVFFDNAVSINTLITKLWEQFSGPLELSDNDFKVSNP